MSFALTRRAGSWSMVVALVASTVALFPQTAGAAATGSAVEVATKVKDTPFNPAPIDPAGIAHLGGGKIVITDSEIDEYPGTFPDPDNIWRMTTAGVIEASWKLLKKPIEPTGLDYNPANKHLYVSNDGGRWIEDIDPGPDGIQGNGNETSTFLLTSSFGLLDAEDVAWDPVGGQIFIAGGLENKITAVSPGPNGIFDGIDDIVGNTIDLSWLTKDIEGIGYRAKSDTLLVVDPTGGIPNPNSENIFEITKTGRLIRTIRINFTDSPSDVVLAPATVGGGDNLYVVDRGNDSPTPVSDGRLFEISTPFANLDPFVSAGPDKSTPVNRAVALDGDSYDDGQPSPNALSVTWSMFSGPGNVSFANPAVAKTTASFSATGTYVLRLTAKENGSAKSYDDVIVTVQQPVKNVVGGVERSTGVWRLFENGAQFTSFFYGNPGDFPFYGDWDCDGDETPGLYRQSDGYVYLRNSNSQGIADVSFFFGNPGDVPMAGDFNGDGCHTVSIYRPSEAKFYIINKLGSADKGLGAADYSFFYGVPGDVPFVGDWTGNGIDTPGLRRSSDGFVYLRNTNTQGVADVSYFYGNNGDVVFSGDWDDDGDDTLGLYRPSNGIMYLRNTNSTGIADFDFFAGFGLYPVAGDS